MNLMKLLPEDYKKSPAVTELQRAIEAVGTAAERDTEDLGEQLFLDTATWGLNFWEELYGIETDPSKAYDFRRRAVRGKMMGVGATTVRLIQEVAESFVDGAVEIVEQNDRYKFLVKMLSVIGIPPNVEDLKRAIEEIKPAHLVFEIIYKYNTHGDLSPFPHGKLRPYTNAELRERRII